VRHNVLLAVVLISGSPSALATEFWVDAAAPPGGDGSAARAMTTITAAIKAARGEDAITIRKGT
jgi:hypothetical protein